MRCLIFFLIFIGTVLTYGQTTTISQPANFSSTNQGMFGPNSNFNLNFELPLFNVPWNNTFNQDQTVSTIVGTYGYQVSGGTSGYFGATFYSRNWNDGNIVLVEVVDEADNLLHEFSYTYDDKINYKNSLPLYIRDPLNWTKSNITQMSARDFTGLLDLVCNPCSFSYKYNLDERPVEIEAYDDWKFKLEYE